MIFGGKIPVLLNAQHDDNKHRHPTYLCRQLSKSHSSLVTQPREYVPGQQTLKALSGFESCWQRIIQLCFFLKSWPLFCLFSFFSNTMLQKTVSFSGIRTRIVGIEGKHADHLTTTTAHLPRYVLLHCLQHSRFFPPPKQTRSL